MADTITVKEEGGNIKINNTPDKSGGTEGIIEIPINEFGNTDDDAAVTLELFKKQQRYLNWLDSWKDLKAGGGAPGNYQQFVNGLGVWTDGVNAPDMAYNELHNKENYVINSVLDTLTNRSWTKVKRGSDLDKKLSKNRVQHDCGLGFESFVEKIQDGEPLLYKTLGTFLDPAGDIQGGENYPTPGVTISFEQSFMNAMGFPGNTSVMGKATNVSDNRWTYKITYGSGCQPVENCKIERDEDEARRMEDRSFNKQKDPNRKFFGGNNQKGNVLKNVNVNSNDKRKLIVSKELGDRMQIFCHMVMVKLNPNEDIALITCDMVVFITCIILKLPVIYTGTSLVNNQKYCEALDVDPTIMKGKFYSITEYNPDAENAVKKLRIKYTQLRKSIIADNQKLIDLVIKFAQKEGEFATIGITIPGEGEGVPQQKNVLPEFFYRILAVLNTIQGKLHITSDDDTPLGSAQAAAAAAEAGDKSEHYKSAIDILKRGEDRQGIMPTGGDGDYPHYRDDDAVKAAAGVAAADADAARTKAVNFLNDKIKNIKRDCLLLHFIHIKKGQAAFSINPSIKSFTATKPAQNNKTFFGEDYKRGMTIHDIARKMISLQGGGGKHTTQTGGEGDRELFEDYKEVIDGPGAIVHINCEEPILNEGDVLPTTFEGREDFPPLEEGQEVECVKVNKSKEFVDDSLKLVDKIIIAIGDHLRPPFAPPTDEQKTIIGDYVQNIRRYLNCIYDIGFDDNKSLISIANQDSWFKGELEGIISYVCMIKGIEAVDEDKINSIYETLKVNINTVEMAEAEEKEEEKDEMEEEVGKVNDGAGEGTMVVAHSDGAGEGAGEGEGRSSTPPPRRPKLLSRVERGSTPSPAPGSPIKGKRKDLPGIDPRDEADKRAKPTLASPPPLVPLVRGGGKRRKHRTKKHAKKRTRNGKRRYTRNKKRPHNKKKRRANKKAKTHRKKPIKSKKGRKTTRKHLRRRSR